MALLTTAHLNGAADRYYTGLVKKTRKLTLFLPQVSSDSRAGF